MKNNSWIQFLLFGWVIAANMLLFIFGGYALDKRWNTSPLFIIIGMFIGFFACTLSGIKIYKSINKNK